MNRIGNVSWVLLVLLVVLGVSAGTAPAAEWRINGVSLGTEEKIAPAATIVEQFTLVSAGAGVNIACTALEMNKGKIVAKESASAQGLDFTGCSNVGTPTCKLSGTVILSKPIHILNLVLEGTNVVNGNIFPQNSTFAIVKFEGGTCALAGEQGVTGKAPFKLSEGQQERINQEFIFNTPANEVKIAGVTATLKGKATFRVEKAAASWSFR